MTGQDLGGNTVARSESKTHEPVTVRGHLGGTQELFEFTNGYGASVVRSEYAYGGADGLWELAVLDRAGHLTYDTPVTSDVLGYLTRGDVDAALDAISALPEAPA